MPDTTHGPVVEFYLEQRGDWVSLMARLRDGTNRYQYVIQFNTNTRTFRTCDLSPGHDLIPLLGADDRGRILITGGRRE